MSDNWEVIYLETETGKCPTQEFLDKLEEDDPELYAHVILSLEQLQDIGQEHPAIKPLKNGLFEFRIKKKHILLRFPMYYEPGKKIIITHGFRKSEKDKKQQGEIRVGFNYMKSYRKK